MHLASDYQQGLVVRFHRMVVRANQIVSRVNHIRVSLNQGVTGHRRVAGLESNKEEEEELIKSHPPRCEYEAVHLLSDYMLLFWRDEGQPSTPNPHPSAQNP